MYPVARSALARGVGLRRAISPLQGLGLRGHVFKEADGLRAAGWRRTRPRFEVERRFQSSVSSPQPPPPNPTAQEAPRKPLHVRATTLFALTLLTFTLGFAMAASPALSSVPAILSPPSDAETLTDAHFVPSTDEIAEIERQIFAHPLTRSLLQDEKYIASRPHLKVPKELRAQNLTGGTLLGPDKIAVPPLQFTTEDGSSYVSLQWLGPALCGHPGIVHGGLLATLLDEGLARCCFPALPNKVAVTATLKIDYKRPCMAGQIVVLRAETTKVEGRKAWVTGRLTTLPKDEGEGTVLTEGEALFIEPRQAAAMKRVVN